MDSLVVACMVRIICNMLTYMMSNGQKAGQLMYAGGGGGGGGRKGGGKDPGSISLRGRGKGLAGDE